MPMKIATTVKQLAVTERPRIMPTKPLKPSVKQQMRIDSLVLKNEDKTNEIKRLNRSLRAAEDQYDIAARRLDIVQSVSDLSVRVPTWRSPKARHKKSAATPLLMLSDLHLGEVVAPEEIEFCNGFDVNIAEDRLRHVFDKAVSFPQEVMSGLSYKGIVCALGGDFLSGSIHPELLRTNAQTDFEAVAYWVPKLAAGIGMLADHYGQVYVPCVAGNHDRSPTNRRVPSKKRAQDSFTWIIYHWLQDHFRDDPRVKLDVSTGSDIAFNVYDTRFNLTHGDQFKGGNGIGGVAVPIMRGNTKKMARQASIGNPYDYLLMGHFHQFLTLPNVLVNGSLKGYDEYAYCVTPETPVLTKTLDWVPAGDLKVNQDLWGFTDDPVAERGQPKEFRVWEDSSVVSTGRLMAPTVKVTLESGRELITTPNHKWLARACSTNKKMRWVEAKDLHPNLLLARYMEPWVRDTSWEAGWLAGMFDGEGSFSWRPGSSSLSVSQKPGPVMNLLKQLLTKRGVSFYETEKLGANQLNLHGQMKDKLRFLGEIGAIRLIAKVQRGNRLQVTDNLWDRVVSVEDAGIQEIVTLETSSGTYFADGYGAHNTSNFGYERPSQMLLIMSPDHGIVTKTAIHCDLDNESWKQ